MSEQICLLPELEEEPESERDTDLYYTPLEYIVLVRRVLGEIDLDPFSSEEAQRTVQAKQYFTAQDDAFKQPWSGRVFSNHPYSISTKCVAKIIEEYDRRNISEAIVLSNTNTDTIWCQSLLDFPVCFVKGRIYFLRPADEPKKINRPFWSSMFTYLGPHVDRFERVFSGIGRVKR